jgi:hypothetical protein
MKHLLSIWVGVALSVTAMAAEHAPVPVPVPNPIPSAAPAPTSSCVFADWIAQGLIAEHDSNKDGLINVKESLKAFPRFSEALQARYPYSVGLYREAVYTYAFNYGSLPNLHSVPGIASFQRWLVTRPFWHYAVSTERVGEAVSAVLCVDESQF